MVGGARGGVGVIVGGEIFMTVSCISVEGYFYWDEEFVAIFQYGLRADRASAITVLALMQFVSKVTNPSTLS